VIPYNLPDLTIANDHLSRLPGMVDAEQQDTKACGRHRMGRSVMDACFGAVDIGSNTVHLIVAATDGHRLTVLTNESVFVRLAGSVLNQGSIPDDRILKTAEAMLHLRNVAQSFGVQRIGVVATEVARTASNTRALLSAVQATTGLEPKVLSGLDEAMLTFRGVTHGRHLPASVAAADLGGGSLEIILAELGLGAWHTSQPIGAAYMHNEFVHEDPPRRGEIERLQAFVAKTLERELRTIPVQELLVCGGTANALMRLVQQDQGRAVGDRVLRLTDIDRALAVMLGEPAALVAKDFHLRQARARLLPAGATILRALIDRLHLEGLAVSPAGIHEGIILAMAHYGDEWLEAVRADTYVWGQQEQTARHMLSLGLDGVAPIETASGLATVGLKRSTDVVWHGLRDQVREMLQMRRKARAGDEDAIHDMRVGARRARTLLDAFAPCFAVAPTRHLRQSLKDIAGALGHVRDTDVAIADLRARLARADDQLAPALRQVLQAHLRLRERQRAILRRQLSRSQADRLMNQMSDLRLDPAKIVSVAAVRASADGARRSPLGEEAS
jgi:hypothetical protein